MCVRKSMCCVALKPRIKKHKRPRESPRGLRENNNWWKTRLQRRTQSSKTINIKT